MADIQIAQPAIYRTTATATLADLPLDVAVTWEFPRKPPVIVALLLPADATDMFPAPLTFQPILPGTT